MSQVLAAAPSRIAVSDFAHLRAAPTIQQNIAELDLSAPEIRLAHFAHAAAKFLAAGYVQLGMDHFMLPSDPLAVAQRYGLLRWDLEGYSASAECDYVGLGLSAIGSIDATYSRNCCNHATYGQLVDRGEIPVTHGMKLTHDDLVRRAVIRSLMCHLAVPIRTIEIAYLVEFERYFCAELAELAKYEAMGFVESEDGWLRVTPRGRFILRRICTIFDRYSYQP